MVEDKRRCSIPSAPSARPVFSTALDAQPAVSAWLSGLDDETRRSLRDDITPKFKEIPASARPESPKTGSEAFDYGHDNDPLEMQGQARAHLADDGPSGLDSATLAEFRAFILRAMGSRLSEWQIEAFVLWLGGENKTRIARELGVSRASVRAAIDGQPHHRNGKKEAGAIKKVAAALANNQEFLDMAKKKMNEKDEPEPILGWYRDINTKPELFAPLSFLYLLSKLANARREVRVADVLPYVPRACVTPFITLLRAHGYAACDGQVIRIHRLPVEKETR